MLLKNLEALYLEMDRAYHDAASYYGFNCTGCELNCCMTRFYHHTLIEWLYLYQGYALFAAGRQSTLQVAVDEYHSNLNEAQTLAAASRLMCPLNIDGRCSLYSFRPMICRLHGISHELSLASGQTTFGPGCHLFDEQVDHKFYKRFDRTPFYQEMAQLEQQLRGTVGFSGKIKVTLAGMLAIFA